MIGQHNVLIHATWTLFDVHKQRHQEGALGLRGTRLVSNSCSCVGRNGLSFAFHNVQLCIVHAIASSVLEHVANAHV